MKASAEIKVSGNPALLPFYSSQQPHDPLLTRTLEAMRQLRDNEKPDEDMEDYKEDSTKKAFALWRKSFKQDTVIYKQDFKKAVWTYLTDSKMLVERWYLRGLKDSHLEQLFDLYTHKQALAAMDIMQFCHAFLYLNRNNIVGEEHEITFGSVIELISSVKHEIPAPLLLSRKQVEKQWQSEDKDTQNTNKYSLCFDVGRSGKFRNIRLSYGMNLVVVVSHAKTKTVQSILLISSEPREDGKGYFIDAVRAPHDNLGFVKTTADALLDGIENPPRHHLRRPRKLKRTRGHRPALNPALFQSFNENENNSRALEVMNKSGFCLSSDNDTQLQFERSIAEAVPLWQLHFKQDDRITKEQFRNSVWRYLNVSQMIARSHYLRKLKESHLEQMFDIYTHTPSSPTMGFEQFCHVFQVINRQNLPHEKQYPSLGNTIELLAPALQEYKLDNSLFISRLQSEQILQGPSDKAPKFLLRLSEGRLESKESYGMDLVLSIANPEKNTVDHVALVSLTTNEAGKTCFVDAAKKQHTNLAFVSGMVEAIIAERNNVRAVTKTM